MGLLDKTISLNWEGNLLSDQNCTKLTETCGIGNNDVKLLIGVIAHAYPSIGTYDVFISNRTVSCKVINQASDTGFGVRAVGNFSVGERVLCFKDETEYYILGGIPVDFGLHGIYTLLSGCSNIGAIQDKTSKALLMKGAASNYTNEAQYAKTDTHLTTCDQAPTSSWFARSETGISLYADALSAGMYADEATGVWVFSDDSFLRLSGINLQEIAGGTYSEYYYDNTECTEYKGHSFYSWEPLGFMEEPSSEAVKVNDSAYKSADNGSTFEPKDMLAKPFHRVVEYGGYLGHGFQRVVNAPSKAEKQLKYGKENKLEDQYCLSRYAQFADGSISIESLKSIDISKKCYIPLIQQLYPIDDFTKGKGDSSDEYDFKHENIELQDSPEFQTNETNEIYQELMALADYHAYLSNYKVIHAFANHKKDYYISEESSQPFIKPDYSSCFSKLRSQQFAEPAIDAEIDIHKQLKSKYYATESGISFMPEGGVTCYGGYGEEFRMGAGSSVFSAPGDVWIKAGRNIHLWAGNDIILRAKECIEESASEGSIRIKAQKNLELLGGNEESNSGILIESKGTGKFDFNESGDKACVGGILLRTEKGPAVVEGEDVYIRSSCSDKSSGSGSITLDSGDKSGYIYTIGKGVKSFIKSEYVIAGGNFDDIESGTVNSVVYITMGSSSDSPGNMLMNANVINKGTLTNKGAVQVDSSITITGVYCSTVQSMFVSPLPEAAAAGVKSALEKMFKIYETTVEITDTTYNSFVQQFYIEGKVGNESTLKNACFSYRTDDEYDLDNFKVYADRWQNIAEEAGASTDTWEEKEVKTKSEKGCYPFPGDKYFNGEKCLVFQPLKLYNQKDSTYENRKSGEEISDNYKNPKYEKPELKTLKEYTIIGK